MRPINVLSLFDGISCGMLALQRAGIPVNEYYSSEIDKWALEVTRRRNPDAIQLGDVTKFQSWDLPKIDLIMGGSPCFVAGTKILTMDGLKSIEDVAVGDEVYTHGRRFRKVLKVGANPSAPTFHLKAQGIKETEVTGEHPYYVRKVVKSRPNGKRTRTLTAPEWLPVELLSEEHLIGLPIISEESNGINLTEEEAFILGRYLADGHVRKDYRSSENRPNDRYWQLILSIGNHKVEDFLKEVDRPFSVMKHSRSTSRVVASSKRLVELAEEHCGHGALDKSMSMDLLKLPKVLLKRLLDGYFMGDGQERDGGVVRSVTISEDLSMCLNLALAKVYGVNSSNEFTKPSPKKVIEGRNVNQSPYHTITFRREMKKSSEAFVQDGFVWLPVRSVSKTGSCKTVYNLEVDEDNSYVANNAVVHNCQGFSGREQLNFRDPRSKLFFEFVKCMDLFQPRWFLLENVKMNENSMLTVSRQLGVDPVQINSSLVSAQNRRRLYWTNLPDVKPPTDRQIFFSSIRHDDDPVPVTPNWERYVPANLPEYVDPYNRNAITSGKCSTLRTNYSTGNMWVRHGQKYRKIHPIECERLQNLPDGYTEGISCARRYITTANGWTVDVIAHVLESLKKLESQDAS